MELYSFDLIFSLSKNVWVIHLSLLLLSRLFANSRNTFGTHMAMFWMLLAISMAFENIFEFATNILNLLLNLDDLGDTFVLLVLVELSVMRNYNFDVMFIYDFLLEKFKMPNAHVLLQVTLNFYHLAPLLNKSLNALINDLKQSYDMINKIIIKFYCLADRFGSHLLLIVHISQFLLDQSMKITAF